MENRWSVRKPVTTNAVVDSPRIGIVHGTLRDISLGGVRVDTGSASFPLNSPVTIAFNLSHEDHGGDFRLHATVVRQDSTGVALLFGELDTETIRSLRAALYGSNVPLRSPSHAVSFRLA